MKRPGLVTRGSSVALEEHVVARLELGQALLGVDDHRAQLEAGELRALASDAGLPEEGGAAVVALDPQHQAEQERPEHERG